MQFILDDEKTRMYFEQSLARYDTEIDWPMRPHGSVVLKCTLTYTDPLFSRKAPVWATETGAEFHKCMGQLDHNDVSTLQEVWPQVGNK